MAEIEQVLQQAISDPERGLGKERLVLEENLLQVLAEYVNGDARLALNCLELMVDMASETENGKKLDRTLLKEVLGERQARFDKQGDRLYDLISALHKIYSRLLSRCGALLVCANYHGRRRSYLCCTTFISDSLRRCG